MDHPGSLTRRSLFSPEAIGPILLGVFDGFFFLSFLSFFSYIPSFGYFFHYFPAIFLFSSSPLVILFMTSITDSHSLRQSFNSIFLSPFLHNSRLFGYFGLLWFCWLILAFGWKRREFIGIEHVLLCI